MESHRAFDKWLREGRPLALEREAMAHLEECRLCRDELATLDGLAGLYASEEEILSSQEVAGIRFQLEAACRRGQDHVESLARPWYLRSLWVPAGALALLLILMSSLYLFSRRGRHAGTATAKEHVRVVASAGSVWRYLSRGKATVVAVDEGVIAFTVPSLQRTESFHVVAGDEWVEVRGTSFTVTVSKKRLEKVVVSEGVVSVHAAGENRLLIREMSWVRPKAGGQQVASTTHKTGNARRATPAMAAVEPVNRPVTPVVVPARPLSDDAMKKSPMGSLRAASMNAAPGVAVERQPKQVLARRFADAYRTLQSGNWRKAVGLFSSLYREKGLGGKRADVLFWLAQAHLRGGHYATAKQLLARFLQSYPRSWRAPDARKQLELLKSK